jgi:hypothetical protein
VRCDGTGGQRSSMMRLCLVSVAERNRNQQVEVKHYLRRTLGAIARFGDRGICVMLMNRFSANGGLKMSQDCCQTSHMVGPSEEAVLRPRSKAADHVPCGCQNANHKWCHWVSANELLPQQCNVHVRPVTWIHAELRRRYIDRKARPQFSRLPQ